ncbi:MAG: Hpt domain-containing protein [Spirochaetes bacterium]|nr:Hpt domain-containing protein [Spirochaetota bacterium]
MNLKSLAHELGLDEAEYKELLELFIETTEADTVTLHDGIIKKDRGIIEKAAHSIKGSSGNLGLTDIYGVSSKLVETARSGELHGLDKTLNLLKKQLEEVRVLLRDG